jgi:hypothetical protein
MLAFGDTASCFHRQGAFRRKRDRGHSERINEGVRTEVDPPRLRAIRPIAYAGCDSPTLTDYPGERGGSPERHPDTKVDEVDGFSSLGRPQMMAKLKAQTRPTPPPTVHSATVMDDNCGAT